MWLTCGGAAWATLPYTRDVYLSFASELVKECGCKDSYFTMKLLKKTIKYTFLFIFLEKIRIGLRLFLAVSQLKQSIPKRHIKSKKKKDDTSLQSLHLFWASRQSSGL